MTSRGFVWQVDIEQRTLLQDLDLAGAKVLKEWFAVLLTCSVTSRKEELLVMVKAKRPHIFSKYALNL